MEKVKGFRFALLWMILVSMALPACGNSPTPEPPTPAPTEEVTPEETPLEGPPPYTNPDLPIDERVEDLLGRMTLAEKIGQMTQVEKNSISPEEVAEYAIGSVLSGGGGYPRPNTPEGWLEMVDEFKAAALETRLGIPLIYGVDAVHGHNNVEGAVVFPHNVGLGATRDPALVRRIGEVTAAEVAATDIYWNFAPVVAVPQDIRWGRTYEAYGEDTGLVTELATAYFRGLQGDDLSAPTTVLATPKHFVGDGGTTWGTSTTQDWMIDQGVTEVSEEVLRAVHLPPYEALIDEGAQSIMVSFSSWGGMKMHAQRYMITEVLKGELGFEGFVVSDWAGIDQISPNYYEAVVTAINAGIDMNMVPYDAERFIRTLAEAVEAGDVPEARVDDAVGRVLRVKFALGLFDRPLAGGPELEVVGSQEHRILAREAVAKSLVLLKNEGGALPIGEAPVIFVGGEGADDVGIQSGGWTVEWQGTTGNIEGGTTILEGIEEAVGAASAVHYNRFGRFERMTDDAGNPLVADVGIAVVGERPYAEGMGDEDDLSLSDADLALIERMREHSETLIVILVSGRPIIVTDVLEDADAFVAAWLPGTEGAGVGDALFGGVPFTGKLPHTWPRSMDQVPLGAGEGEPLFPYGYGLTTE
jgi:beta-glucosidase